MPIMPILSSLAIEKNVIAKNCGNLNQVRIQKSLLFDSLEILIRNTLISKPSRYRTKRMKNKKVQKYIPHACDPSYCPIRFN